MAQSVRLPDELIDLAREEAALHDWTVSNQVSHWMSIGKAIERSGVYDYARISRLLERQDKLDAAAG